MALALVLLAADYAESGQALTRSDKRFRSTDLATTGFMARYRLDESRDQLIQLADLKVDLNAGLGGPDAEWAVESGNFESDVDNEPAVDNKPTMDKELESIETAKSPSKPVSEPLLSESKAQKNQIQETNPAKARISKETRVSKDKGAAVSSVPKQPELKQSKNSAVQPLRITSRYGFRRLHGRVSHHDGIDIGYPYGTAIRAAWKGTVIFAGWKGGYGRTVIIDHGNGRESLYAHASRIKTKVGAQVDAGQKIAEVGSTGRSFGPHLHFELRINGHAINPESHYLSSHAVLPVPTTSS